MSVPVRTCVYVHQDLCVFLEFLYSFLSWVTGRMGRGRGGFPTGSLQHRPLPGVGPILSSYKWDL